MYKRSDIKDKLKEDSKFKFRTRTNQLTSLAGDFPGFELNDDSKKGDITGAREGEVDGVTKRIRKGWSRFRDLVPLLTSKSLPLRRKGRLSFVCVRSIILYGS